MKITKDIKVRYEWKGNEICLGKKTSKFGHYFKVNICFFIGKHGHEKHHHHDEHHHKKGGKKGDHEKGYEKKGH